MVNVLHVSSNPLFVPTLVSSPWSGIYPSFTELRLWGK